MMLLSSVIATLGDAAQSMTDHVAGQRRLPAIGNTTSKWRRLSPPEAEISRS